MRVVFHENFHDTAYSADEHDNAAVPERLVGIMQSLRGEGRYDVDTPEAATREDLLRGHSEHYVASVENTPLLFNTASLAAGAAIMAARQSLSGEAMFACLRPPGHHASRSSA